MSGSTDPFAENLLAVCPAATPPGTVKADEPSHPECVAMEEDGGGAVSSAPTPNPTLDADEAISGVTDVQRPFSLADHDGELEDNAPFGAPLLLRCPKGGLLRLGFVSYDLASSGPWQLLPSAVLVPQLPVDFAGTFGGIYTGGGLLLMEKFAKQQYHLLVSNPTSKSQRQLPPMMDFFSKPEILGIFVDIATATYKIPVVQRKYNEKEMDLVVMQEYNSISNSWKFAGQWRNRYQVEPIGATYVNGTLFFLTYDRQAHLDGKLQRVFHIYYLNDFVWERLELPLGLGCVGFPAIFEYKDRLMLAGGLHGYDLRDNAGGFSDVVHSVYIWEHDWSFMTWIDICNMPSSWLEELYKCPPMALGDPPQRRCTLEVTAGGNFACVASSNGRVTQCDIPKNDWTWVPKTDLAKYADGSERILVLECRPDIPV